MSMNFCIEVDGSDLELIQTPTFVTKMCLATNRKGRVSKHRAVNAYAEYVRGLASGTYKSAKEAREHRESINEHIAYVQSAVKNAKKFEVYTT